VDSYSLLPGVMQPSGPSKKFLDQREHSDRRGVRAALELGVSAEIASDRPD
jgi:hypothetical protein